MSDTHTNGNGHANGANGTSAADDAGKAAMDFSMFPKPPKFDDKKEEREYLKGRLAAAFRIFAKFGFDEGVAGHITCRVCLQRNQRVASSVFANSRHNS